MVELEELMKILRVQGNQVNQGNQRQEFQGANHQFQGVNHQFQGGNHQFQGGNNQSPRVGSYRQVHFFPCILETFSNKKYIRSVPCSNRHLFV